MLLRTICMYLPYLHFFFVRLALVFSPLSSLCTSSVAGSTISRSSSDADLNALSDEVVSVRGFLPAGASSCLFAVSLRLTGTTVIASKSIPATLSSSSPSDDPTSGTGSAISGTGSANLYGFT